MQKPLVKQTDISAAQAIELLAGLVIDPNTPVSMKIFAQVISGSLFKCLAHLEKLDSETLVQAIKVEAGFLQQYCPLKKIESLCKGDTQAEWLLSAHKAAPLMDREQFVEEFLENYELDSFRNWLKGYYEKAPKQFQVWRKKYFQS